MASRRLIVGMSGASGVVYGVRLLERLRRLGVETHLVLTHAAVLTLGHETELRAEDVRGLADRVYSIRAVDAPIASGSFPMDGMIVAPCSVRCLSAIASGVSSDLLTRAADVTLKERRRLVLMVRETPLHAGHLHAMSRVTELGAIVAPPLPAFYTRPKTIEELVDHSVGRVLDLFGLEADGLRRWGAPTSVPRRPRRPREPG